MRKQVQVYTGKVEEAGEKVESGGREEGRDKGKKQGVYVEAGMGQKAVMCNSRARRVREGRQNEARWGKSGHRRGEQH